MERKTEMCRLSVQDRQGNISMWKSAGSDFAAVDQCVATT